MHRWLSRLTFTFLILAAVALWESRHAAERGHNKTSHYLAAIALTAAGIAGLRERHRRQ